MMSPSHLCAVSLKGRSVTTHLPNSLLIGALIGAQVWLLLPHITLPSKPEDGQPATCDGDPTATFTSTSPKPPYL